MEISQGDLLALIGEQTVKLHMQRQQIEALRAELQSVHTVPSPPDSDEDE